MKRAGYCRSVESGRETIVSELRSSQVRIEKRADDEKRVFRGYGAVFYRDDDPGTEYWLWSDEVERIMPGAFDRVLEESQDVRGLFNHNPDNLLGRTTSGTMRLAIDGTGLAYEIDEDPDDPDSQRVATKIDRGDLTGSSFAFIPEVTSWRKENDIWIRQIEEMRMVYDVGPVTFPAYSGATSGRSADRDQERRSALSPIVTELESHRRAEIDTANELELVRMRAELLRLDD